MLFVAAVSIATGGAGCLASAVKRADTTPARPTVLLLMALAIACRAIADTAPNDIFEPRFLRTFTDPGDELYQLGKSAGHGNRTIAKLYRNMKHRGVLSPTLASHYPLYLSNSMFNLVARRVFREWKSTVHSIEVTTMPREKTLAKKEIEELERWDPWDTFREMERMFRDFFTSPFSLMRPGWRLRPSIRPLYTFTPDVDLRETDRELILSATLPGMERDDIDIDVTEDRITLTGERKIEEERPGEQYHVRQQCYGAFHVSYPLPVGIKAKDVKASYKNGILEVVMPKAEVKEPHKVKVEVGG